MEYSNLTVLLAELSEVAQLVLLFVAFGAQRLERLAVLLVLHGELVGARALLQSTKNIL